MWCLPVAELPGVSAKQKGVPRPDQVSATVMSAPRTVSE